MVIGVWGDSISYGSGDSEALGWVGRLRKSLFNEDSTNVYNFGVCGDTTLDILKRFNVEADAIKPDIVIFAVAINDSKFPQGGQANKVNLENFKENIRELTKRALTYTSKVYLVGATKVDETTDWGSGSRFENEVIKKYNFFLEEHAKEHGLVFIEVFDVLNEKEDLYDGLHPNSAGYEKMFRTISKVVNPGII